MVRRSERRTVRFHLFGDTVCNDTSRKTGEGWMSRGPRYTKRYTLTGSDTPEDCLRRLGEMAADPVRQDRIRLCVQNIYELVRACTTAQGATGGGQANNSVSMKIRHFHNELELHVHRHCLGALYRSEGIAALAQSQGIQSSLLRQEHTIPTNVLAGMVFRGIMQTKAIDGPAALCRFLLTQSVVTAITRTEDKDKLAIERWYEADRHGSKWQYTHPEFRMDSDLNRFDARPFLRYYKTGLAVIFWPTGETINLETDTLADHIRRVAPLPLYDWRTYFDGERMAA
ncbi:hypothetical protein [Methylobacterium aquaticum]|nr:hypothetical protein [Methylobacterium aquaticum]